MAAHLGAEVEDVIPDAENVILHRNLESEGAAQAPREEDNQMVIFVRDSRKKALATANGRRPGCREALGDATLRTPVM